MKQKIDIKNSTQFENISLPPHEVIKHCQLAKYYKEIS